jgi:hypothetical protein
MNSNKGFFASICSFFSSLFSSAPAEKATAQAAPANTDGLTSVERYIRNKAAASTLTSVEQYIRNKAANSKPLTTVELYIRSKAAAKPMTSVERYIQSKA